jgi:dTDP-4-amino-4,6-dideoxygalactose transaminase
MQGYRDALPELTFQAHRPGLQAHQFAPGLLPRALAPHRAAITAGLAQRGVGCATYFSPHVLQQDYFSSFTLGGALPVTDDVGGRIISLPLFDSMTAHDLAEVTTALRQELACFAKPARRPAASRPSRRVAKPAQAPMVQAPLVPSLPAPAATAGATR